MTRSQIRNRLEQIVEKSEGGSKAAWQDEAFLLFGQESAFDSVSALQLVFDVEEKFDILIKDEEIHPDNFHSLDALTDFVRRKISQA